MSERSEETFVDVGEKVIWRSNLLLGAFSLSVANLNLLPVWRVLVFASDRELYFVPRLMRHDYLAALLLMLIIGGVMFLLLKALRSRDSCLTKWIVLAVIVVCLINPLDFLRVALRISLVQHLHASLAYLGVAIAIASVLLRKWYRFSVRALCMLVVILCPFAVSNSVQAAWRAVFLDNANRALEENAPFPQRSRMDHKAVDLQRVIWIIFDELDQRILFDNRPSGYEFPAFDSFRQQSIYVRRLVPPGGRTLTALPTYWIGRRVVKSVTKSPNTLEVQIEGDEDLVPVSDFDNLFEEASAAMASIGLTGFYHPYCRLFGEFLDRCDSFHRGVSIMPSKNLTSSMRSFARTLVPGWRRANVIQSFKGIRSAGLEMAVDRNRDLVIAHVPMPHGPPVYDPASDQLTIWGFGLKYPDNVVCADKMLGEIEQELRNARLWNDTVVILMSDHGWSRVPGFHSDPGAIPLMIKMANQNSEIRLDQELDSVLSKQLLLGILKRELRTPREVVSWLGSE